MWETNMTSTRCSFNSGCSSRQFNEMSCKKKQRGLTPLWGECRYLSGPFRDIETEATLEIAKDIINKAMVPDQEPEDKAGESFFIELPQNVTAMDPLVLHTIQLSEYSDNLEETIMDIYRSPAAADDLNVYPPTAPEVPRLIDPIAKRCSSFTFPQFDRKETDFLAGQAQPDLRLSISNARRFLKKSVATLFAHAGFEEASEAALDVVTDVLSDVYHTLSQRLRVAVDQEAVSGQSGFNDPLERVFTEMNLGSVEDLLRYYEESVVEYHDRLNKQCNDYAGEYELAVETKLNGQMEAELEEDFAPDEEEEDEEEDDDDDDVPEIHFPALDMEDQLGLQPSLEPGFQMLNSLEHDETLQNLDIDEEMKRYQEVLLSDISDFSNESWKSKKKRLSNKSQQNLVADPSQNPACSSKDPR